MVPKKKRMEERGSDGERGKKKKEKRLLAHARLQSVDLERRGIAILLRDTALTIQRYNRPHQERR